MKKVLLLPTPHKRSMAYLDSKYAQGGLIPAETSSTRDRYFSRDSGLIPSNSKQGDDSRSKRLGSDCLSFNNAQEEVTSTAAHGCRPSQGFSFGPRERFSSIQVLENGSGITASQPYVLVHKKAVQRMSLGKSNFLAPTRMGTQENTIDGIEGGAEGTVISQYQNQLYSFIHKPLSASTFHGQAKPPARASSQDGFDCKLGSSAIKSSELAKESTAFGSNTIGEASPKFGSGSSPGTRASPTLEISQFAQRSPNRVNLAKNIALTDTLDSVPSEGICKQIRVFKPTMDQATELPSQAGLRDIVGGSPSKLPKGICLQKLMGDLDEAVPEMLEKYVRNRPQKVVVKSKKGLSLHRLDSKDSRTFNEGDGSPSYYALLNPFKVFKLRITDNPTPTQEFTSNLNLTRKVTNKTQAREMIRLTRTNFRDGQFINTSSTPPLSVDKPVRSERFLDKGSNTSIDKNLGKVPSFNFHRSGGRRTSAIKSKYSTVGAGEERNTFSEYRAESHHTPQDVSTSQIRQSRKPVLDSNVDIGKLLSSNKTFMKRILNR